MKELTYVVADVFTQTPLQGNPVAVFTDIHGLSSVDMQLIANEMHLSETVFVLPPEQDGDVRVRIFTPVNELPFAGHPTLGAAFVLGKFRAENTIRMETGMGTVQFVLQRNADGHIVSAKMQQPIPTWKPFAHADILLAALGLTKSTLPVDIYHNGPRHVFIGMDSLTELSKLAPDQRMLAEFEDVAINCFAGSGLNWRMRMFSPAYGVVEDAATGSAAGPLILHLARHGLATFEQQIEIVQGVEIKRPSTMFAKISGSLTQIESVEVEGSAVIVIRGTLSM